MFALWGGKLRLGLTIVFKGNKVYVTAVLVVKVEILAKGIQFPASFWEGQ